MRNISYFQIDLVQRLKVVLGEDAQVKFYFEHIQK